MRGGTANCTVKYDENVTYAASSGNGNVLTLEEIMLFYAKSDRVRVIAAFHTGNLAGSAKCYEAIFQKYGVISVTDLVGFMAVAQMFCTLNGNLPRTDGLTSVNLSGGENAICADICERKPRHCRRLIRSWRAAAPIGRTRI
jgi:hypothetical protein